MKKKFLFLLLIISHSTFSQSNYENGLKRADVVELSFDLIDRFYEFQGLTLEIRKWLEIETEDEFREVLPEFTNPNNREIRDKIFYGIAKSLCEEPDNCEPNFYAITQNQRAAKNWANYVLDYYVDSSEREENLVSDESPYRYVRGWKLLHKDNSETLDFLIAAYKGDNSCMLKVLYREKSYYASHCNDYKGEAILYSKDEEILKINFSIPEMTSPVVDISETSIKFDFVDIVSEYSISENEMLYLIKGSQPRNSTKNSMKDLFEEYDKN